MENNENYQPENNYQATDDVQPEEVCQIEPADQAPVEAAPEKKSVKQIAEQVIQQAMQVLTAVLEKLKTVNKTVLIAAAAAVLVLVIGVPLLVGALTNTYKTPLNLTVSYMNNKKASAKIDGVVDLLNGLCESEAKALLKVVKKTDAYEDIEAELIESFEDQIEDMEDEYGKNYKYSYKVESKDKLEKEDLREFRDQLKSLKEQLDELVDEADDFDSDDWEDLADDLGMTKAEAKKLVAALEDVCKELKTIKVTAGYEVEIVMSLNGSELDEPEEEEMEIKVYKVNGRWVSMDALYPALGTIMAGALSF